MTGPVLNRPWPGGFHEVPSKRKAENVPWANSHNLLLHEETKGCKKIFVIPTKTPYVIAIESKDTVSISYFVISDITPSQWNFYLANIHTWTVSHISKLISGRKNTKKPKTRNAFTFQNYISGKGYYYSWGLCGWLTWHANNWKGISQIRWVR